MTYEGAEQQLGAYKALQERMQSVVGPEEMQKVLEASAEERKALVEDIVQRMIQQNDLPEGFDDADKLRTLLSALIIPASAANMQFLQKDVKTPEGVASVERSKGVLSRVWGHVKRNWGKYLLGAAAVAGGAWAYTKYSDVLALLSAKLPSWNDIKNTVSNAGKTATEQAKGLAGKAKAAAESVGGTTAAASLALEHLNDTQIADYFNSMVLSDDYFTTLSKHVMGLPTDRQLSIVSSISNAANKQRLHDLVQAALKQQE